MIPWGPTGEIVYNRTYSRKKPDGSQETWPETVYRVCFGNLALVHGNDISTWSEEALRELALLIEYMTIFKILPAGRHLWASGVKGRQYLFNCHVSGWGEKLSRHFEFTFLRLMEGGGVGANYGTEFLRRYGAPRRHLNVHIVCDPSHPDYQSMLDAGVLSDEYDSDWAGAYSVEDSREAWADALVDLIDTYMTDDEVKHANRVYDVSRIRWAGARLKTFGGTASGPKPFAEMLVEVGSILTDSYHQNSDLDEVIQYVTPVQAMEIDHAIAQCVVSGGVRRSARMAQLHWLDPHIDEFLVCKLDRSKHWTTNISVIIDNEFVAMLGAEKQDIPEGEQWRWAFAHRIHRQVVEGMLTHGEPGYWNIDKSNAGEPGDIIATNPCGEIALEAWENCNLGHINLDAFAPTVDTDAVDIDGLVTAHELVTRFLIRATYGDVNDDEQAGVLLRNRRIGVGHFGVQGFWAKQGVRYSEVPFMPEAHVLLERLAERVDRAAAAYAHQLRIPVPVKTRTMAPTGSIAKMPGSQEGGHPIYARTFLRRVRFSLVDPAQRATFQDAALAGFGTEMDGYDQSGNTGIVIYPTKDPLVEQVEALGISADVVEAADELSIDAMLRFQAMYQTAWADNAVSFTVNVPAEEHQAKFLAETYAFDAVPPAPSVERVDAVAEQLAAYLPYLKGTTLMLDGSRPQAPYERISEADYSLYQLTTVADGIDEDCATGACPVR